MVKTGWEKERELIRKENGREKECDTGTKEVGKFKEEEGEVGGGICKALSGRREIN